MKPLRILLLICAYFAFAPVLLAAEQGTEAAPATGTVAETIEVEGYTYLRLDELNMWIAIPTQPVFEGDQVEFSGGMEMRDF